MKESLRLVIDTNGLRKIWSAALAGLLMMFSWTHAEETQPTGRPYIGVFGGVGMSTGTGLQQLGTVFLNPPNSFPVLPINAQGPTSEPHDIPVGGIQFGYEWGGHVISDGWQIRPAAELEGIYIGRHKPLGVMPVQPKLLGTQYVKIPMSTWLVMVGGVLNLETPYSDRILPYVGGGIGAAFVSIRGAESVNPLEPGINHFNSLPNASDFSFACQLRAGVKAEVMKPISLFLEYRFLSISPTQYTFGATYYPGLHLPTTDWKLDVGR